MDMKTLLTTILTDLQGAANLSYVTDANIFITPDEDIIPEGITFPAIGIKDGAERFERDEIQDPGDRWDMSYRTVQIIVYVAMTTDSAAIVGSTSQGVTGILDICGDIDAVLESKYSAISGIEDFRIQDSGPAQVVGGFDSNWIKKSKYYEYTSAESN